MTKEPSAVEKAMQDPERAKRINKEYAEIAREELKIRAAKALGFADPEFKYPSHVLKVPDNLYQFMSNENGFFAGYIAVCELKFTTSEDWFKLLLNELYRLEHIANENEEYGPMAEFCLRIDNPDTGYDSTLIMYLQTPLEERVKFAVETLESKNAE